MRVNDVLTTLELPPSVPEVAELDAIKIPPVADTVPPPPTSRFTPRPTTGEESPGRFSSTKEPLTTTFVKAAVARADDVARECPKTAENSCGMFSVILTVDQ
jgi:hypothetical protein